jgi:hypothetical protein
VKVTVDVADRVIHREKLADGHPPTNAVQQWDAPVDWIRAQMEHSIPKYTTCGECFPGGDLTGRRAPAEEPAGGRQE